MGRLLLLLLPALVAGVAATVVAVGDYDSESAFALNQRTPRSLEATALERTVRMAPEPVPGDDGKPGRSAKCRAGTEDGYLRNPWRCSVRYPSGHTISYLVRVRPDGSFDGVSPGGTRRVFGRVGVPAAG